MRDQPQSDVVLSAAGRVPVLPTVEEPAVAVQRETIPCPQATDPIAPGWVPPRRANTLTLRAAHAALQAKLSDDTLTALAAEDDEALVQRFATLERERNGLRDQLAVERSRRGEVPDPSPAALFFGGLACGMLGAALALVIYDGWSAGLPVHLFELGRSR